MGITLGLSFLVRPSIEVYKAREMIMVVVCAL